MSQFSPSEAAFSGFRLVRERPRAVTAWAGALLAFGLIAGTILYMMAWQPMLQMEMLQSEGRHDPAAMLKLFPAVLPAEGLLASLALFFYPVLYSAVFRTFLGEKEPRLGGLAFGSDELRLLGAFLLLCLSILGLYILGLAAAVLLTVVAGVLLRLAHAPPLLLGLTTAISFVLAFCFLIWAVIRLSLTLVVTAAEKRLGLRRSWRLTRGHFWSLLGAYVLAGIFILLCYLLIYAIIGAVIAVTLAVTHGNPWDFFNVLRFPLVHSALLPAYILAHLVMLWAFAALVAVKVGPSVAAYKAFSETAAPTQA